MSNEACKSASTVNVNDITELPRFIRRLCEALDSNLGREQPKNLIEYTESTVVNHLLELIILKSVDVDIDLLMYIDLLLGGIGVPKSWIQVQICALERLGFLGHKNGIDSMSMLCITDAGKERMISLSANLFPREDEEDGSEK